MHPQKVSFFVIITCSALLYTKATPIASVSLNGFQDNWNYTIQPHNVPLLSESTRNHILPPVSKSDQPEKKFMREVSVERNAKKLGDVVRSRVSCPVCKLAVGLLKREVEKDSSFEDIRTKFVGICVGFNIAVESVCAGAYNVFAPDVLAALKVVPIGPQEICSLVLGEVCGDVKNPLHDWHVEFPNNSIPEFEEPETTDPSLPTFKVLHLSDTHYDPDYVAGSVSNCEEPLCCRSTSTPPLKGDVVKAGKWGSYKNCDSPKILIDNMLRNIAEQHPDIDYIIWTGDLPPHDIWNQTKTSNLDIIKDSVEKMFEIFPTTPIFPAIGNHESTPAGSFAPPWIQAQNHSVSWLYSKVADHWRKWLPASVGNTVLHGGFYSVLVRPGFRIISLNTNYCHTLSWWLVVNSTDPAKELQWLIYELQQAEDNGEKVHIIGHIPPGSSDCMRVWSKNFNSIVERYENTILAQFYGHSHADEFEVFYDVQENSKPGRKLGRKSKESFKFAGRPIGVAYLGPSVTTYEDHNPAYRIYYVAGDYVNSTREILDHETWTMDLDEANKSDQPKWYRLYSAKSEYMMDDLRPKSWSKLIDDLVNNENLWNLFYKNYYRDSPTTPTCDSTCKLQILCDLRSARSQERHQLCRDLQLSFGAK